SKDNVSSELLRRALHYALERKRFEEVRARQLADEEALKARDEFLAAAAHDLRNPLATIKGTAQLLQRTMSKGEAVTPERLSHSLGTLVSSVNHAISQVTELLDVARVRLGSPLTLDFHPTDMAALCRESVETFQQATERHQLRLTIASQDAQRFKGSWDGHRLRRVVDNLLSNAIKYSPSGGNIIARVRRDDGAAEAGGSGGGAWALLSIADQGMGIPAPDMTRVFERFRRAANVAGAGIRGAGLGLASVRQIVEAHGGAITVESTEGKGSTFTLRLPLTAL
ncbi:MAG TPA: HAMP domain-containing sensor histidine kinase, partial [Chloroflexota bacterium]|nr:HAMP domain-containing sensor histidine kinase [Chloroflexota bacterium]